MTKKDQITLDLIKNDVPEMIIHYIEKHNYLPPQEFIDTVMNIKLVEKPKEEKPKRHFK